jgi:predicted double-glycine peptidase
MISGEGEAPVKKLAIATLASLISLLALAVRSSSAGSTATVSVTTWSVSGIENTFGAYTGTAQLTLSSVTDTEAKMTVTAVTNGGQAISWSGHGSLDAGAISLTFDPGFVVPKATSSYTGGTAEYVLGDDGTLQGYWALTSTTVKKAGPGGCDTLTLLTGTPLLTPSTPGTPMPKLPANALPVPMVTQPDEYSCGAASLQAVMYYYRVSDGDLHNLYKPLGTNPTYGTQQTPILDYARSVGLTASYVTGMSDGIADLQSSLASRNPVMLTIEAWKATTIPWAQDQNDGHWVVLIGLDANYAYFMDPWAHFGYGYMPIPELLQRWHCSGQHEAIYFQGMPPAPGDGLVRMQ